MTYRNNMQIMADMLNVARDSGMNGAKPTSLLTKANLSHSRLMKFLTSLTGAGLMNEIEYLNGRTFVITPRGREYLESYERFSDIASSFGLEL